MADLNKIFLLGRLTRDLGTDARSFSYVGNGIAKAEVSIACNRSKKQGDKWVDETSYFNITIWGKTAENLKPYLTKGREILVTGFLKQDRWEKDGKKESRINIVAEDVKLIGGKGENKTDSGKAKAEEIAQNVGGEVFPEDIPF